MSSRDAVEAAADFFATTSDNAKVRKFCQRREMHSAVSQHLVTSPTNVHYGWNVPEVPGWLGIMDNLIKCRGVIEFAAAVVRLSQLV